MAQYNLKSLINGGSKLWFDILKDLGYVENEQIKWPEDEDFIPLTIQARHSDGVTSDKITVYLHKCTFTQQHHILHTGTDVETYNEAVAQATNQSQNDTKIHFILDEVE